MSMPKGHGVYKQFKLTSFAVDHPTSVLVMMFIIILAGVTSYITIPKESNPEITVPNIVVNTIYVGVAPADVEMLVTRPLEEELNDISDVKQIISNSTEGVSSINVEFEPDVDINEALQQVREKVDLAKPELPDAAEDPAIFEINLSDFPIMQVNIAGEYDLERLREVAEDVQDRIELIGSVLEVDLSGGLEREVQVDVDLARLQFYDVSFNDVVDAIRAENVTVPGGSIDVGSVKFLVRVPGEFETTDPISDIVVVTRGGRPIYVSDVATLDFGFKDRDSFARLNDNSVVTLSISKRPGENIIETADAVRAVMEEMQANFPPTTEVAITSDQSEQIREMVSSLQNNIISGLILVVGVLLFFLGFSTASFVGIAIPLSMLLSFSVMQLADFSMNMVVLFSLILALGMLVDNGIVVVENIYRFRESGYDRVTAAKLGTAEVAVPIIASTATTLAAFFPMTFWPGMIGEFMKFLPLTLIITLSSSLFVALVVTPTLCSLFLEAEGIEREPMTRGMKFVLGGGAAFVTLIMLMINPLTASLLVFTVVALYFLHTRVAAKVGHWFMNDGLPRLVTRYEGFLRWALDHRLIVVSGAAASLVFAIMAFGAFNAGVELFPEDIPPETVYVQIEAPIGTRIEEVNEITRIVEQRLQDIPGREDFESVVSTVGTLITGGFGAGGAGSHFSTISVNFVNYEDRQHDAFETMEHMRASLGVGIAGAEISVEKPNDSPTQGPPISIEVSGDDFEVLQELGDRLVRMVENNAVFAKLDGLESDLAEGRPEMVIDVDRERAALYGLNTRDVGSTVRSAINGIEASQFRDEDDEYDITVRLAERWREDLSSLDQLTVSSDNGQIPLSSVASWWVGEGYGGINRKDLERVVTVSSDVRAGFNATAVLTEVQGVVAPFADSLPPGYAINYTGQQEDQEESMAFLTSAFLIAVMLIGFILISQFDSVTKPIIIMSSVLLSTVGVLLGLIVFRMPFGIIMTGVGVISLAGIVVNNAIVLIDYVDLLRGRDGLDRRDALVQGGATRFRPVILTAITTILGLVPLAIGLNFDFFGLYASLSPELYWGGIQAAWWGPMAIAVIAGLAFATFLTLVLVPVMYSILDDLEDFVSVRLLGRTPEPSFKQEPEPEAA